MLMATASATAVAPVISPAKSSKFSSLPLLPSRQLTTSSSNSLVLRRERSDDKLGRREVVKGVGLLLASWILPEPSEAREVALPSGRSVLAEEWGTHSLILERFFLPGLSPENSVARIRQTAEGMHDLRHMLDTMSWRYVLFYIRQKTSYLSQDLKNAIAALPENRRKAYVRTANELVDNMSELDHYIRTPKVYESYVFYEKTLKSLDDLVALLA